MKYDMHNKAIFNTIYTAPSYIILVSLYIYIARVDERKQYSSPTLKKFSGPAMAGNEVAGNEVVCDVRQVSVPCS